MKKLTIITSVICMVSVCILGILLFLTTSTTEHEQMNSVTTSTTSISSLLTTTFSSPLEVTDSTWLTYTDSNGFTLQYPATWRIYDSGSSVVIRTPLTATGTFEGITLTSAPLPRQLINELNPEFFPPNEGGILAQWPTALQAVDKSGWMYVWGKPDLGDQPSISGSFYNEVQELVVRFVYGPIDKEIFVADKIGLPSAIAQLYPNLNHVLNTFRFSSSVSHVLPLTPPTLPLPESSLLISATTDLTAIRWITYTDSRGFSIEYPGHWRLQQISSALVLPGEIVLDSAESVGTPIEKIAIRIDQLNLTTDELFTSTIPADTLDGWQMAGTSIIDGKGIQGTLFYWFDANNSDLATRQDYIFAQYYNASSNLLVSIYQPLDPASVRFLTDFSRVSEMIAIRMPVYEHVVESVRFMPPFE